MLSSKYIVHHVDDVRSSPNELRNNIYTTNRNLLKLLNNDIDLANMYTAIFESRQIKQYDADQKPYQEDTLVWFYDEGSAMLYILRCIVPNNYNTPVNDRGKFDESGWRNEFEQLNILDYGLSDLIEMRVVNKFKSHETDPAYHSHGMLSLDKDSENYIENKLLKKDLTNINSFREHVHFPIKTGYLTPDGTVLRGFYRRYDTGYIEYDILFRLGYTGEKDVVNFGNRDIYACNTVVLNQLSALSASTLVKLQEENSKYFMEGQSDIFRIENALSDESYSIVGTSVYKNRNDYINTYAGTIRFPIPFNTLNYSVFCSDVMCQTSDLSTLNVGANTMVFADRTYDSIKAVYVTYPNATEEEFNTPGFNSSSGGLATNGFHVKIAGTCAKRIVVNE